MCEENILRSKFHPLWRPWHILNHSIFEHTRGWDDTSLVVNLASMITSTCCPERLIKVIHQKLSMGTLVHAWSPLRFMSEEIEVLLSRKVKLRTFPDEQLNVSTMLELINYILFTWVFSNEKYCTRNAESTIGTETHFWKDPRSRTLQREETGWCWKDWHLWYKDMRQPTHKHPAPSS